MTGHEKKPSNPRMHNPDGMYAAQAREEDFFSLRDYFASQAIIAALRDCNSITVSGSPMYSVIAAHAYACADAMLEEREKQNT
jgi:hypothetical protein